MKRLLLVLSLLVGMPGAALAGMTVHNDSDMALVSCDNALRDAAHLMTLGESDPSNEMPKTLAALHGDEKLCRYPTRVNAADGYAAYAQANALHRAGDTGWKPMMDSAILKLTKCQSDYQGQTDRDRAKIGADCTTALAEATKRKTDWDGAAAPGPSASP